MERFQVSGDPKWSWCVYTLECKWTPANRLPKKYRSKSWAHAAAKADRRLYVGSTNDLDRRLEEHRNGNFNGGAEFTTIFEPDRLLSVQYCRTEYQARRKEEEIADERQSREQFVFQA